MSRTVVPAVALLIVGAVAGCGGARTGAPAQSGIVGGSGFSGWLTGTPGPEAPFSVQKQFALGNAHTVSGFPTGTVLHRLVVQRVDGATYSLYGFHYGDELCLRLVAHGISGQPALSCAPQQALENASLPVQVAETDYVFDPGKPTIPASVKGHCAHATTFCSSYVLFPPGGRLPNLFGSPGASASFGFVADGVTTVTLTAGTTSQPALVADDAFLSVRSHPAANSRVTSISAQQHGHMVAIPFTENPLIGFAPTPQKGPIPGPKTIQQRLAPGTIGWLVNHEPRGQSVSQAHLTAQMLQFLQGPGGSGAMSPVTTARVIRPDPQSTFLVAVYLAGKHHRTLCYVNFTTQGSSSNCTPDLTPLNVNLTGFTVTSNEMNDEYQTFYGLARDGVANITLYLSNGQAWPVPLADNVFAIEFPQADLPAELVAYDTGGQTVGITPVCGMTMMRAPTRFC